MAEPDSRPRASLVTSLTGFARQRTELAVLAVLLVATLLLPGGVPLGIYGLGIVAGAGLALQAIGIVLVYRANRIINFAQVQMGALAGVLFVELIQRKTFILGIRYVCPGCIEVESVPNGPDDSFLLPVNVPGWLEQLNFWVSMLFSIAVAVGFSYLAYTLVIKRFRDAPRLIVTVVTIGLAQVFQALVDSGIPWIFSDARPQVTGNAPFPFTMSFELSPARFNATDVVTLVVAAVALVSLAYFFGRSALGVVLRGSSEDPNRAESLGVNIGSVNSVVWILAGGLSAIASVLAATSLGVGDLGGPSTLLRMLAAAVIASMLSIPIAVVAALAVGVLDQAVLWTLDTPSAVDAMLLVVVVVILLAQRARATRTDAEADRGWRASREMRPIPAELRDLDVVRRWVRIGRTAGIALILGLPWALAPDQTNLAAVTFIYAIVGLSILVLTGWAGQISLGQFAIAAVGGYFTALLPWPFPLPVIVGGIAGAAAALLIGVPALRLRGLHLAITTLALAVVTTSIVVNPRYLGKALPTELERPSIVGLDLDDQRTFYYFVLVFLIIAVVAVMGLRRSRTARALIACRDNEASAQSFGINLMRARLSAFAVSGFMAAFAGGLFAFALYGTKPSGFTVEQSVDLFLMTVIGGLGSVAGPLIGVGTIGAASIFSDNPLLALLATGLGVVVLLMFLPGGLGEAAYRIRDAMLRRVADRYHIEVPSLIADRRRGLGHRAPIAPKVRTGGGTVFVPARYRPEGQWAVAARHREALEGGAP